MRKNLQYLFDPLCGWCYAIEKALHQFASSPNIALELVPTGIFSGKGAQIMDKSLASYAWKNDQRIAQLTGQIFSERYRQQVLCNTSQRFDSGSATLALTAVAQTAPERELAALSAIQHARYVEGADVTDPELLASVLSGTDLLPAAALLLAPGKALLAAVHERTARARVLMSHFGARGLPTLILTDSQGSAVLPINDIFSDPQAFFERVNPA